MRVLIIGAGGIVGQYLRLYEPQGAETIYTRRQPWGFYRRMSFDRPDLVSCHLDVLLPDVIVNLVGENRPDVVEKDPEKYLYVNEHLPVDLGLWCDEHDKDLIHVSTQGVFDGNEPPYPSIPPGLISGNPVNAYGRQKLNAERLLSDRCKNWTVARLTFIVGVRPLPNIGRENPFESMIGQLSTSFPQRQVSDRFFSPCFAHDAAKAIWGLVDRTVAKTLRRSTFNVGTPERISRFDLAKQVNVWGSGAHPTPPIVPVSHSEFTGLAERPKDTTYAQGSLHLSTLSDGIAQALKDVNRAEDRAVELAMFFGCGLDLAKQRLGLGFGPNHTAVAADWRKSNPQTDDEILRWYRETVSYCWELSAYHADSGFNYSGMCKGIAEHLKAKSAHHVLCLGDGIGDMSMMFSDAGLSPIYHDLYESVTANFAQFRFDRHKKKIASALTVKWTPAFGVYSLPDSRLDAIIAHDFFEHLTNVEEWARACYVILQPGGLFLAQNAFAIGDPDHGGSIPMHLARNNKYAEDDGSGRAGWDTLLDEIGFERTGEGNWRRKPA